MNFSASLRAAAVSIALVAPFAAAQSGGEAPVIQLWQAGDPGQRLLLRARVVSASGEPVPGATLQMRQADGGGSYTQRYSAAMTADDNGTFRISTAVPGQYNEEKHIHVSVSHPGYRQLFSEIIFRGDPNLSDASDPLAIALEEVQTNDGTVMMGGVEFVLEPE